MSADQQKSDDILKSQFRDEYRAAAKNSLWFWSKWRSAESLENKIAAIAEKKLDKDLQKGVLIQRAMNETAPDEQEQPTAANLSEEKPAPQPIIRAPVKRDEPIMIPDVPALQAMKDDQFILYVMENLARYEMASPAYREAEELTFVREKKWPKDMPKPAILITPLDLKFNAVAGKAERQEEIVKKTMLMYSNGQEQFVRMGGLAVQYFNKYGQIPQDVRNAFIFEHTKDILRSTPYRKDEAYLIRCDGILMTVYDQLMAGQHPAAPQPKSTVKVSYNFKK